MTHERNEIDALIQRFIENQSRFKSAADDVTGTLKEILAAASIHATVTCRVKDIGSFRSKIALRTDYDDPWKQITDKVGARAIVYRTSQVNDIHGLITDDGRLEIYDVTDKRGILSEKELGYSGLHLDLYAPARDGDIERIPVELQIRTIAQHAWSEVSHKLLYKPQAELDPEDRRAVWRLVALVEVFDSEVARVIDKVPDAPAETPTVLLTNNVLDDILSAQYARFESNPSQRDLTALVIPVLLEALPADAHEGYGTAMHGWATDQRSWLQGLYDDYGTRSAMAAVSDYVLWSQPESIGILEYLAHRPWALLAHWRSHGLPDAWLKPFAAVGTDEDLGLS